MGKQRGHSTWRQFLIGFAVTLVFVTVVRETEVVEHLAYSIERGRLRAIYEKLPSQETIDRWNAPSRRVADVARPSVVYVETKRNVSLSESSSLLERLGRSHPLLRGENAPGDRGQREYVESGLGSGFVVDSDAGHIITNFHVIEDAEEVYVILHDGRRFSADVIGVDPESDLAVLKIEADRLHAIEFGDSRLLGVGDEVFALGNPFGLDGTFSRGIVSGLGRSNIAINNLTYEGFIQTDAVINPGNSGGPLVNLRGEVIGVNTAIATHSGQFSGVGFAIPSHRVVQLLPQLLKQGRVVRGFLGVGYQDVHNARSLAEDELDWHESDGVIITTIQRGSPADIADLRVGDVLVSIGGSAVGNSNELKDVIAAIAPGTNTIVRYWRDSAFHEVDIKLVVRNVPRF